MKKIPLTQGQEAIVDDWWYDYLMQWKWYARRDGTVGGFYAAKTTKDGKKVFMHRVVANTPDDMICDHIHHNTLDNRESELRNVTYAQSVMNRRIPRNNKTGFVGVFLIKKTGKYRAFLIVKRKMVLDRHFDKIEDAIKARKDAEKKYFGEYAYQEDVS